MREAVGLAVHFQDMDVVGQAVEERAGEAFLAECGGPFVVQRGILTPYWGLLASKIGPLVLGLRAIPES